MKKIGIVGAGNMGSGIVQKTAQEGLSVVMVDIKPEFVERGINTIRGTLQEAVDRKILKPEKVDEIMGRIEGTTDLSRAREGSALRWASGLAWMRIADPEEKSASFSAT